MQFFYKNSHNWCDSVKMTSVPSLFSISLRYVKPFKIFVFLIFLFWIGVTFFSVLQLGPRNGGLLVPISISKCS